MGGGGAKLNIRGEVEYKVGEVEYRRVAKLNIRGGAKLVAASRGLGWRFESRAPLNPRLDYANIGDILGEANYIRASPPKLLKGLGPPIPREY